LKSLIFVVARKEFNTEAIMRISMSVLTTISIYLIPIIPYNARQGIFEQEMTELIRRAVFVIFSL